MQPTLFPIHWLILQHCKLLRLLTGKKDEFDRQLSNYNLKEIRQENLNIKSLSSTPDARVDALEATLIAMGAAVLLGAVVSVVCIVLSRLKHNYIRLLVRSRRTLSWIFIDWPQEARQASDFADDDGLPPAFENFWIMIGVTKLEKMKNCVLFAHWIFFYSFCSRFFLKCKWGIQKKRKTHCDKTTKEKKVE